MEPANRKITGIAIPNNTKACELISSPLARAFRPAAFPGRLDMALGQRYLPGMVKSIARVLLALIVALAVAMPVSVRAMPMVMSGSDMSGMAGDQPCQNCPDHQQQGNTAPDKLPACPAAACITAPAVLPVPALVPGRIALRSDYVWPPAARLAGADPAPDPFPPRPIVIH